MAGLDENGFEIKRFSEIQESLDSSVKQKFGDTTNTDVDSVFGQLRDVFGQEIADIWELGQAIYDSQVPSTVEGQQQDDNYSIVGVLRLDALNSIVNTAVFTGDIGTEITSGTIVAVTSSGAEFETSEALILSRIAAQNITTEVNVLEDNTLYSITIGTDTFSYTSGVSPTATDILSGLKSSIDGGTLNTSTTVVDETLVITYNDTVASTPGLGSYNYSASSNLVFTKAGNFINMTSVQTGPIEAPANQLTEIRTAISGLDSVTNLEKEITGRNRETDTEYRARRELTLSLPGTATIDAIVDKVGNNVENVTSVSGIENRSNFTDSEGRPPHSFEIVVEGGLDADIAQEIWDNKPAGIETFGTETVAVLDSSNQSQNVNFSRTTPIYLWVDVEYVKYSEESFPSGGEASIAQAVLDRGLEHKQGEDVIDQRFFSKIYGSVSGIQELIITLATSATPGGPPGTYSPGVVAIGAKELANFDLTRITVAEQ